MQDFISSKLRWYECSTYSLPNTEVERNYDIHEQDCPWLSTGAENEHMKIAVPDWL